MDWSDWYWLIVIVVTLLMTLSGGPMGFIGGIAFALVLAPVWFVVFIVFSSDDCKQYEYGVADTYYENCP